MDSDKPGLFGIAVCLILFVFPAGAALVDHWASAVLGLLTLMGIGTWLFRGEKIGLSRAKKTVMAAFAAYFAVAALFMFVHGVLLDTYQQEWKLGHETRMLAFAPVFYLFLRAGIKPWAFWYGICAGAVVSGIYALAGISGIDALIRGGRVVGGYNPIVFGDASMAFSFMSLAGLGFFAKKHKALIAIPIAAAGLGLAAVFLSGVRGAVVAGPLLLVIFLIQAGNYPRPRVIRSAVVSLSVVLLLAGFFISDAPIAERAKKGMDTAAGFISGRVTSIEASADASTAKRFIMWSEALKIIQDNPWIGTGKTGFKEIVRQRAQEKEYLSKITRHDTPHNMYLTSLTHYGLAGLVVLLGIFLCPLVIFIRCIKNNPAARDYGYAGVFLILAYMQFALTESVFGRTVPIAIYLILTASVMALCRKGKGERSKERRQRAEGRDQRSVVSGRRAEAGKYFKLYCTNK